MGPDFEATVRKVAAYPRYKTMSKSVYKSDTLTSARLLDALAQFMGSLVSAHSRYDAYQAGDTTALTLQEKAGLNVFMAKGCNNCHTAPLFTSDGFRNNGLEDYSTDGGRVNFTKQEADRGKFSVPSLRNAAVSGPYMHNGIFRTLEEVVAFYRTGIQETPNLDALIPAGGFSMTDAEAAGLVGFLKALNDDAFLKNSKFKKP
jgi:cytochrome c peroxidase